RDLRQALVRDHPDVAGYASDLATTLNNLAVVQAGLGQRDAAYESFQSTRALQERLTQENPGVPDHAVSLGGTYCNLGNLLKDAGRCEPALAWYTKAIAALEPL